MTGIIFDRKGANLRTISPIDDEKDQSFQESWKRLRSLLIGRRGRVDALERGSRGGHNSANAPATPSGAARGYLREGGGVPPWPSPMGPGPG